MKVKVLDSKFKEAENWQGTCYAIYDNGDVELYKPYDTAYPIITAEDIRKLAEILKEEQ